jgi:glycine/D-amino acid oxidase-like deaminating enzyme
MLGVAMEPAIGGLIAELRTGRTPHVDPTPYAARAGVHRQGQVGLSQRRGLR